MVYDIDGNETSIFDVGGSQCSNAYNVFGVIITAAWFDEITISKYRSESANTNYYVVEIPQTRPNGNKQYPFVYVPNGANGGTMSTLTMMQNSSFYFGMNGGYFDYTNRTYKPYGITIQNGVIITNDNSAFTNNYTLTIDSNGNLGYAERMSTGVTAQDVLNSGAVSALLGLVPLVVNSQASGVESSWWTSDDRIQRQIIGQKTNGDYVIITAEGRNFDNSTGFTVTEAQNLCLAMGLKFAMAVDGGGSTETVIDETQINTIYEGTSGRIVPTYIVFNGTDTFNVPS